MAAERRHDQISDLDTSLGSIRYIAYKKNIGIRRASSGWVLVFGWERPPLEGGLRWSYAGGNWPLGPPQHGFRRNPMSSVQPYGGRRILEAMKGAPAYAHAIFEIVLRSAEDKAAILDFGAGEGEFAARFRERGIAVDCVEPDSELRESLAQVAGRAFGDIGEIPADAYDFTYTINVLEHIDDLPSACAELWRVLRPNGRLFVFVPAFPILWTKLDDEVGHCRRFTRQSLTDALTDAGFLVRRVEYFDALGFPSALGVRMLERCGLFSYNQRTIGFYDRFVFPFSRASDNLFGGIFGKNLVAVAEKT